jgi:hypothetical protein
MWSFMDNRRGLSRRSLFRVVSLALGGLAFMRGGPSQIKAFDPKMSAPAEIRSVAGEVQTRLPDDTSVGGFS